MAREPFEGYLSDVETGEFLIDYLLLNLPERFGIQRVLEGGAFAELGCGTGDVVAAIKSRYPQVEAIGTDINEDYLREAHQKSPDSIFVASSLRRLPFADRSLPYLFSWRIYQLCNEDRAPEILAEAFRVLKPGGVYLLCCEFFQEDELIQFHSQIESAGFKIAMHSGWDYAALVKPLKI